MKKPFLRLAPSTLTSAQLDIRLSRLNAEGRFATPEYSELVEERLKRDEPGAPILGADLSTAELRQRVERLTAAGHEFSAICLQYCEELFRRTNGEEGFDAKMTMWLRLYQSAR